MADTSDSHSAKSFFESRIITFVIGQDKKHFHVHENAISKLSSHLARVIQKSPQGSNEGAVVLENIDATTFANFLDFAYTGDYISDGFSKDRDSAEICNFYRWVDRCESTDAVLQHCTTFLRNYEIAAAELGGVLKVPAGTLDFDDALSLTTIISVLECHIRLYHMADAYDAEILKKVCLVKLWNTFICCPMTYELAEATMHLVPLIWDKAFSGHELRKLWMDWIMTDPGWFQYGDGEEMEPSFAKALSVVEFCADFVRAIPKDYWPLTF